MNILKDHLLGNVQEINATEEMSAWAKTLPEVDMAEFHTSDIEAKKLEHELIDLCTLHARIADLSKTDKEDSLLCTMKASMMQSYVSDFDMEKFEEAGFLEKLKKRIINTIARILRALATAYDKRRGTVAKVLKATKELQKKLQGPDLYIESMRMEMPRGVLGICTGRSKTNAVDVIPVAELIGHMSRTKNMTAAFSEFTKAEIPAEGQFFKLEEQNILTRLFDDVENVESKPSSWKNVAGINRDSALHIGTEEEFKGGKYTGRVFTSTILPSFDPNVEVTTPTYDDMKSLIDATVKSLEDLLDVDIHKFVSDIEDSAIDFIEGSSDKGHSEVGNKVNFKISVLRDVLFYQTEVVSTVYQYVRTSLKPSTKN